ncbi:MAG: baseplate J/gp47 family protein [Oscillospiraceae bacterium]|jgi:uncharacterized phage protein gp47/JayE|nr:baseplate J/gp47 family protein [Oscillospiraceae bacterium]
MAEAYESPAILQGQSADEIQARMLAVIPDIYDKSEGSIPFDFTRPAALEKAETIELTLSELVRMMFPQWAQGQYLDYHARAAGLWRRPANTASGEVLITAVPGTVVPAGFVVATPSNGLTASVLYRTTQEAEITGSIDDSGNASAVVSVIAVSPGASGNAGIGTITLQAQPMQGIVSVTNSAPITGGTDAESDDSLRERLLDLRLSDISFTGCDSDYVRWAKEIPGIGNVVVIPEANGAGTVTVVLLDSTGAPANTQLINDVYEHIVSPGDRSKRLAPIGAIVTVTAPDTVTINLAAAVVLGDNQDLGTITQRVTSALEAYWTEAAADGEVRYSKIAGILSSTVGISDWSGLTVNGTSANVPIGDDEYPQAGTVTLSE